MATLTFTNNASGSPHTVAMSASVVDPPGVPGKPTATQTGPGEATVTITPPTTGGLVTTYKITTAPGGATCTIAADANPLACTISGLTAGKTYTFTAQSITGSDTTAASEPSSPLTLAAATSPIVTIKSGKVTGKGKKKKVNLSGATRKSSKTVYVYRATSKNKPAVLVAVRKSKSGKWGAKKVSLGRRQSAFFCARVGSYVSDPIRVPNVRSAMAGRALPSAVVRGDQIFCA
ncbi:MAG: fibronectin type III domain-containing protein [Candidatus Nanopelagicales bacterium]